MNGGSAVTVSGRGLGRAGWRALTALEFQGLAAVPLQAEWFANIDNRRTRRAYRIDFREFAALSSLFERLCDANAVTHNPVKRVKRPKVESYEARRRPWATVRRGPYSMRLE